ncbi:amidase domain-containing protein [Clostridium cellulovorans]|uniref:Putative amidase domain-containing protein n=1 Tax=Clostridium cellulovorans (strain ATCC 35296 / DSM 3052 / OCM 3 / 743B) TaxID=573061 RepID=D9SRQ1_CLOC7|nr:amidase domain-containing protein [Clostridium cellulovorans]ADL50418.1 hypothetical protein Clocel_0647 [Clostridium cellulovorans 743B]
MKRKIKKTLMIWIMVFVTFTTCSVQGVTSKGKDTPEQIVDKYFSSRMRAIVTQKVEDMDVFFSKKYPYSQKNLLFNHCYILRDYIINFAEGDYIIERVEPMLIIMENEKNKEHCCIRATLLCNLYWNAGNPLGESVASQLLENHQINLTYEEDGWKIERDIFCTEAGSSLKAEEEDLEILIQKDNEFRVRAATAIEKAKESAPARIKIIEDKDVDMNNAALTSTNNKTPEDKNKIYNRALAYNYAITYALVPNRAFRNMEVTFDTGDATNFVSQCIKAGGALCAYNEALPWYYESKNTHSTLDDTWSWHWSTPRGLFYILDGNYKKNIFGPKAKIKVIKGDNSFDKSMTSDIMLGDVIQYAKGENADSIYHSSIVTGFLYNSGKGWYEPLVSQHSSNLLNVPWKKGAYKTYFISLTEIN